MAPGLGRAPPAHHVMQDFYQNDAQSNSVTVFFIIPLFPWAFTFSPVNQFVDKKFNLRGTEEL